MAWGVPKLGTVAEVASGDLTLTEPASPAAGDLQIACIAIRSTVGFTNAGWTKIEGQLTGNTVSTGAGIASGEMWYRIRGGAAGTLVFSRVAGDLARGCILSYTGAKANTAAALSVHSSNTLASASVTATTGTITTVEANELIVAMIAQGDNYTASAFDAATDPTTASGATDTTTAPTAGTWLERTDSGTNTGADGGLAVADAIRASAGATGTIQTTSSGSARHAMIASAFRILVDTAVAAAIGAVTIAGLAPTVTATSNVTVSAAVGAVAVAGLAPTITVSNNQSVAAGVGAVTVVGLVPSVVVNNTISASVGAVTIAGLSPVVTASNNQSVAAALGAVTVAGLSPTVSVSDNQRVDAGLGALTVAGLAPAINVSDHQTVASALGAVAVAGLAPTVTASDHQTVSAGIGAVTLGGLAPVITASDHQVISTGLGAVALDGLAPTISASDHQTIATGLGAIAIAGVEPFVTTGNQQIVEPGKGVVTIAGLAPSVSASAHVTTAPALGTITVIGLAPSVLTPVVIGGRVGAKTLDGFAPTVTASDHQLVAAETGAVATEGLEPTVEITAPGSYLGQPLPGEVTVAGYAPAVSVAVAELELAVASEHSGPGWSLTDYSASHYTLRVASMAIDCAVDFDAEVSIRHRNPLTRVREKASGLTDVAFRLSATSGGAAIHTSLSGTAEEAGTTGRYVYTFDQADLLAHLIPTYSGQTIYLVVEKPGDIDSKSFAQTVAAP